MIWSNYRRNKNITKLAGEKFLNLQKTIDMNNAFWLWLGRHEKASMEGRWMGPRRRGKGALTFDNYDCGRQFQCHCGFPRRNCPYDRQSCVLLNIMFVVGRQAVNVSSCTNKNLHQSKANICREDKASMLHLDPSSVRHSDKRWLGPHFPTATASVSRATSCWSSVPICH